jgi:hypothetical protein
VICVDCQGALPAGSRKDRRRCGPCRAAHRARYARAWKEAHAEHVTEFWRLYAASEHGRERIRAAGAAYRARESVLAAVSGRGLAAP